MRRFFLALGFLACGSVSVMAQAPTSGLQINSMTAGGALSGSELIPLFQTTSPAKTTTPAAIGTYLTGTGTFVPGTRTISTSAPLSGGGALSGNLTLSVGNIPVSNLNSGTGATSATFWRGDGTWATPAGGGGGVNTGTAPQLAYYATTGTTVSPIGSAGTTTTVLHGNPGATPTFGPVALATDVTGNLPVTNLGSGTGASSVSFWRGDGVWATPAGAGGGTVNSVALSVPASSIFGVTGSPVTNSGTLGLTTTGTSGGVPFFSSASVLSSSNVLTAGLPLIGGGAGTAPQQGTKSGSTSQFVTTTGTQTSGACVQIDVSGNHIAVPGGAACGSGGGGGLAGMTAGQVPIAATATTVTSSLQTSATPAGVGILQTDSGGRVDASVLPGGVTTGGSTISATDFKNGQSYLATTAGQTFTLPAASSLASFTNSAVMFRTLGVQTTVALTSGTDAINGGTAGASIVIPADAAGVWCTTNGTNAFTCPLGAGATDRSYTLSWFSGVDMTAHPVSFGRTGKPRTITGISCRTEVPVGTGAQVDIWVATAGQTPPASGTKLTPSPITANGTAGSEVVVPSTTFLSTTFANASWLVAVFTGSGWASNVGSGACQVATQ